MQYENWPDAKKQAVAKDLDIFLTKLSTKYGAEFYRIDLDREGSFAFAINPMGEESPEEREERLYRAEIYLRAWFTITRNPLQLPSDSWSLIGHAIEIEIPSLDMSRMLRFTGKIVDVETQAFAGDPLVVIQNDAKKPKTEDPKNPYFELIECRASQITSFFPKLASRFKLIRNDGTEVDVTPKEEEGDHGPPLIS